MAQGLAVRHQAHGNVPVMSRVHERPNLLRHLLKESQQLAALGLELLRPAKGGRGIRLRMPENQRTIPLGRVIGAGYGGKVLRRERLFAPRAVRERARPGYLDPLFHTKPLFPATMNQKEGSCPQRARTARTIFRGNA